MIIGFGYKARSGKDTAGEYLQVHHKFHRTAFAYSLKEAARVIFHLTDAQLYGDLKEVVDPFWQDTPRNILQKLGTECLRNGYRADTWVKSVEWIVKRDPSYKHIDGRPEEDWVITDVRFPNEAQAVKSWGGFVVCVNRPSAPGIVTNQHASETSMAGYLGWDYVLDNSSDLPQLYANIEVMMGILKERSYTK